MDGPDGLCPFSVRMAVRRSACFGRSSCWAGLVLLALVLACDRTSEIVKRETSDGSRESAARQILAECVRNYAKLESYEDQAYVLLRYKLDGVTYSDRAPLSIAWEAGGLLGLRVYSVIAGPSDGRWKLRLGEEDEIAVRGQ